MPENHFRYATFGSRDSLERARRRTKTQERGYLGSRARSNECGLHWACAFRSSARQSCVMATDQESNNLDDFDIEQVINWEEHNYASKNLEIQQLPDLDLSTDLPTSGSSVLSGHGTQPTVSHGRTMLIGNQVIGSHQPPQRDPIIQTTSAVNLNPVFPQDASYMISDIRQELAHSSTARVATRDVQPSFPSENFDLPSIRHQRPMPVSGAQVLNYMTGHDRHIGSQHVGSAPQLGHSLSRLPSLHNGMQSFTQPLTTSVPVNESLNPSLDNDEGGDSSIDQLIEDIVDRDMPQGVGDPVVFSTHDVALSNQHQQMHHVMAQSNHHDSTSITASTTNQMAAMARSSSSIATGTGSPLAVSGQVAAGNAIAANIAHAHSPLPQNPSSPIPVKIPSPQMQQFKAVVPMRGARGNTKKPVPLTAQQQPHSPQNMNMGVAHSPRPAPQRSPQHPPQRSPQQPNSAQSPPSSVNAIMSQNISSPMSQMSPLSSAAVQNMNSQVMGSMGMQHSPVASPLNVASPQNQRPSRQASPGGCNIGSPITPVVQQEFSKPQGLTQTYMTQGTQGKVSAQNVGNIQNPGKSRAQVNMTVSNTANTTGTILHPAAVTSVQSNSGNVWGQSQFVSTQLRLPNNISQGNISTPGQSITPTQQSVSVNLQANTSTAQQTSANTAGQALSTFDTAAVLRGLTALKGSNVIPFQLKPGTNQQLQAIKLPQNAANMDLLKQAMVKAGQGNGGQVAGKPMSINTSQGQVFYYILPKGANITSTPCSNPKVVNTHGQQVKMVLLNTNNMSSGNSIVKTVNSAGNGTPVPRSQVLSPSISSSGNNRVATTIAKVSQSPLSFPVQQNVSLRTTMHPMEAMSSVVKAVGNDSTSVTPSSRANHITKEVSFTHMPNIGQQHPDIPVGLQAVLGQGQGVISKPSNPTTVQSAGTTQITFVNESTSVDHFVSVPGLSQLASSVITTHPVTATISTMATKTTPVSCTGTPVVIGDSDDSDTPLAVVAETLRKANGEEKKKKKKKKGEKRKKKDKGGVEKPLPAYQIFFKETQTAIRQQNPSVDFDNVTKIVSQMWENLPEDQKKVYLIKQEKAKKDYEKALEKQKQEPSPKIRKLETSTAASPVSSPKTTAPPITSTTTTSAKEPAKHESITLKIPKAILNKPDIVAKIPKSSATGASSKIAATGSSSLTPVKAKKSKMSFNPISRRICIREGCNMPARTTKERGTQYCSNDCIVAHCRNVFQTWVTKRKEVEIQVS